MKSPQTVLVHDHLNQQGGAEKVLLALHEIFPDSPVYTLLYDKEKVDAKFRSMVIHDSFLSKLPLTRLYFKWFLILMPRAIESFDMPKDAVIISSASSFAKGITKSPGSMHICYCHTPTRYLWSHADQYREELAVPRVVKKILPRFLEKLRIWDLAVASEVDYFIANSHVVADRIKKYYNRDAAVVYPPVEVSAFTPSSEIDDYYVLVSRFRPYKRVDLAIRAFNKLGIPLKIIGGGEEEKRLKKIAKSNIEFLGTVDDAAKARIMSRARALIHPQAEDFGITAVEAMAAGRPVIAYRDGGVVETVQEGVTGVFFDDQWWESLADAVVRFDYTAFDSARIRAHAEQFGEQHFKDRIRAFVQQVSIA